MSGKILILGGYGNFGWRISRSLAKADLSIIIAGRSQERATKLQTQLAAQFPAALIETACFDVHVDFAAHLQELAPQTVIHTCGPFQDQDYSVAKICIENGVHYIDLADGRGFVGGISKLDAAARAKQVLVVSGASTVPGLSSAVVEHFQLEFSQIEQMVFGITPGQKAPRGLATTEGILSYVGKPLAPVVGQTKSRFGWQDLYRQAYPKLGRRWMANCDVPDLDLFPEKYGISQIRFSAGMENPVLHLGIWLMSWGVRLGLPLHLARHAAFYWKLSKWFDWMGTDHGGMHVCLRGKDRHGQAHQRTWFLLGLDNDGPNIPTSPALVLAKKLARNEIAFRGASACLGLVSLEELLQELSEFSIETHTEPD